MKFALCFLLTILVGSQLKADPPAKYRFDKSKVDVMVGYLACWADRQMSDINKYRSAAAAFGTEIAVTQRQLQMAEFARWPITDSGEMDLQSLKELRARLRWREVLLRTHAVA